MKTIDELIEQWNKGPDYAPEEYEFLENTLIEKMISGKSLSGEEFDILTEMEPYEHGDTRPECGYVWQEIIIEYNDKFYLTEVETHDSWGWNLDDTFQFVEVEKKAVVVEKWVPVKKEEE